ncbi:MAG: hypothetical protein [Bacteriophage sp.]|nr:MAG: hypothetical protein [Bacteriophage sp.]
MKLSLAAIVFDSIFMAVYVLNETWPLEPLLYAGLRLCLTFLSMAARLMQQKETASDCPRQIYGTQAKVIIVNENPGSRRGYFWWLFKWID